jgi:hypothetical protein
MKPLADSLCLYNVDRLLLSEISVGRLLKGLRNEPPLKTIGCKVCYLLGARVEMQRMYDELTNDELFDASRHHRCRAGDQCVSRNLLKLKAASWLLCNNGQVPLVAFQRVVNLVVYNWITEMCHVWGKNRWFLEVGGWPSSCAMTTAGNFEI